MNQDEHNPLRITRLTKLGTLVAYKKGDSTTWFTSCEIELVQPIYYSRPRLFGHRFMTRSNTKPAFLRVLDTTRGRYEQLLGLIAFLIIGPW